MSETPKLNCEMTFTERIEGPLGPTICVPPRLFCMLACYLAWHLRQAWAPLTFTDEYPPEQDNPVAPARRSAAAQAKASGQHDATGRPYRSFRRALLKHLRFARDFAREEWPLRGQCG